MRAPLCVRRHTWHLLSHAFKTWKFPKADAHARSRGKRDGSLLGDVEGTVGNKGGCQRVSRLPVTHTPFPFSCPSLPLSLLPFLPFLLFPPFLPAQEVPLEDLEVTPTHGGSASPVLGVPLSKFLGPHANQDSRKEQFDEQEADGFDARGPLPHTVQLLKGSRCFGGMKVFSFFLSS